MAVEILDIVHSWTAGASLASSQFYIATTDTNGNAIVQTTQGGYCIGVIQDKAASGQPTQICVAGVSKIVAGAAIPLLSSGTPVMSNGSGQAIPATSNNHIIGYIFGNNNSTASGQIVSVELVHEWHA